MADTGAPSGAPGARQPQGSLEQQDHEHSPPQSGDILSERGAEDSAPERSQEEDTQFRESEASPVQLTRTSPEPSLGSSNETFPNPLPSSPLRNSSLITDVVSEVPLTSSTPATSKSQESRSQEIDESQPKKNETENVVVKHRHQGVLSIMREKARLRQKQVTIERKASKSEEDRQTEEEHAIASQQSRLQSSTPPSIESLVNVSSSQPTPTLILTPQPSFQNDVTTPEPDGPNKLKDPLTNVSLDKVRLKGPSLEAHDGDEKEEVGIEEVNESESESTKELPGEVLGLADQEEENLDYGDEKSDVVIGDSAVLKTKGEKEMGLKFENGEREGRTDDGLDSDEQGLMGFLLKSRLAPSSLNSDSQPLGSERSDSEGLEGDKVTDRVKDDLLLPPQLVGSVPVSPTDEEGATKAKSDPPTHPNNVTTTTSNTSSTSTASSIGSLSLSDLSSSSSPGEDISPGSSSSITQVESFHTPGVSANSTPSLSGLPKESVREGAEKSRALGDEDALVDEGGVIKEEQEPLEGENELANLPESEKNSSVLQSQDSILLRRLTDRPADEQGVTEAVNPADLQNGGQDDISDIWDHEIESQHADDIPSDTFDESDYLDYADYDDQLDEEDSVGLELEEGSAGPAFEYQEFVSLDPPGIFSIPYNFTGLQMRELTEPPRVWNAREAFMEQVGLKLYMFVPAAVCGVILGIIIWVCFMFCLRAYGRIRQYFFGPTGKAKEVEDLELKSPVDQRFSPSSWAPASKAQAATFDKKKVSEFNKSVVELVHQGRVYSHGDNQQGASGSTTETPSFQSSPKSFSSGIGVSEKENFSDKEEEEDDDVTVEYGNPVNEGGPI